MHGGVRNAEFTVAGAKQGAEVEAARGWSASAHRPRKGTPELLLV